MRKQLFAGLVALAIAVLPGKPAVAADNTGRAIAGLAALAVVGAILANKAKADEKDRKRQRRNEKERRKAGRGYDDRPYYAPPTRSPYGDFGRPQRHARGFRGLPDQCRLPSRQGHALYGGRCMRQAGIRLERLPRRCAVRLPGGNGRRVAFDARCMRHARGWR